MISCLKVLFLKCLQKVCKIAELIRESAINILHNGNSDQGDSGERFRAIMALLFMKFSQNVCLDEIWVGIVFGSSGVKN